MTVAFRPLRNPNPLGFPGGVLPGFDPSHPAIGRSLGNRMTKAHGFSGVSLGPNFLDLLRGGLGTIAGTPVALTDGYLGPATNYGPGGTTDGSSFTGNDSVTNDRYVTMAAILIPTGFATAGPLYFNNSGTSFGCWLGASLNGGNFQMGCSVLTTTVASGIILSANVPYFLAASIDWGTGSGAAVSANFVALRLDTGALATATNTSTTVAGTSPPRAGNGTYIVGNFATSGGDKAQAKMAAVMFAPNMASMQSLLAWASDPWSFWYPRRDVMLVGVNTAAPSVYQGVNSPLRSSPLGPRNSFKPLLAFPSSGLFSSIAISQGTYTLTGKSQTPNSSRSISAAEGTYSQTGEIQNLLRGRPISAAQGTYTLTGEPQNFNRGIKVSAVQGTYTQTGEPQTLGVGVPAVQGSYTLTGKPQSFAVALSIKPVTGVYTLTGFPQVLTNTKFGTSGQALGTKFIADTGNMTSRDY